MKSPCKGCEHEMRDKNHPDCINCPDRLTFMGLSYASSNVSTKKDKRIPCKKCRIPKLEDDFQNSATSKTGKMGVCKICLAENIKEGRKNKREKRIKVTEDKLENIPEPKKQKIKEEKPREEINIPNSLDTLFKDYPETLQYIKEEGHENVRTPEQHVIYLIKLFADNDEQYKNKKEK